MITYPNLLILFFIVVMITGGADRCGFVTVVTIISSSASNGLHSFFFS